MIISHYFPIGDAIDGVDFYVADHNFTNDQFNFTISPGETRCFEVIIIDNNIAERETNIFYYHIGVYNPDREYCEDGFISIEDNEGKLLFYSDIWTRHNYYFSRVRNFDGLTIPAFNCDYCVMSILLKYVIVYAKTNHSSGKNILNSQVGMHKERRILNMN